MMKELFCDTRWLPNFAPQTVLVACALFSIFCIGSAVISSIHQPSLGITWSTSSQRGLLVNKIHREQNKLQPGDTIIAIGKKGGDSILLRNEMIVVDPDMYATYEKYNQFFRYQRDVSEALKKSSVELIDENYKTIEVIPLVRREVSTLPVTFWVYSISGAICFIIGTGVWCYRRGQPSSRLLATAGFCFFIGQICLSIYASRELAIDADLFKVLANINHFFMCLFPYSLLILFWYYPIRLGNTFVVKTTYAIMLLFWTIFTFQWIEFPLHAFYLPTFVLPYCAALPLGMIQWKKTSKLPVERAALKWFLLSILVSLGITTPLLLLPAIHDMSLVFPLWGGNLLVLLMFSGLALGVLRYKLFQLERWWYLGWLWFGSYLLVFGFDILLVRLLQLSENEAIAFAILIVLWIYFPLRQWLWNKWIDPPDFLLQKHLPSLIDMLFSDSSSMSFSLQWQNLLQQIFSPLRIKILNTSQDAIVISENGQVMRVPTLNCKKVYELSHNRKGTRLFGRQDLKLAQSIFTIARESIGLKQAYEQSVTTERKRVMRDLHDDVSGKLLQLIHSANTEELAQLAKGAHKSLRETIYISIYGSTKSLEEILADWRTELNERCETQEISLIWNQAYDLSCFFLTPRQHINSGRILFEAISNIQNHTTSNEITVTFRIKEAEDECEFSLQVKDNSNNSDMAAWVEGVGINNMRTRAAELDGTIHWLKNSEIYGNDETGITLDFYFPFKRIQ